MPRYAIGKILTAFGVRGGLKVAPLTHDVGRFEKLRQVYIGSSEDAAEPMMVTGAEITAKTVHLTVGEVVTRDHAAGLSGKYVFVDEEDLALPPEGANFIHDIIGCEIWSDEKRIGLVVDVIPASQGLAQDIWVIRRVESDLWFPAVKEFVESIDVAAKRIVVRQIKGLLDT